MQKPDARYAPMPHVVVRQIGDESVLFDLERGEFFGLNPVGARIWTMLGEGRSFARIVEILATEHDVGEPEAREDGIAFIEELCRRNLAQQA